MKIMKIKKLRLQEIIALAMTACFFLSTKALYANSFSKVISSPFQDTAYYIGRDVPQETKGAVTSSGIGAGAVAGTILGAAIGGASGAVGGATVGGLVGATVGYTAGEVTVWIAQQTINIYEFNYSDSGHENSIENTINSFLNLLAQLIEDVKNYNISGQYTGNLESFLEDVSLAGHAYSEAEIIASIEALSSMEINFEVKNMPRGGNL